MEGRANVREESAYVYQDTRERTVRHVSTVAIVGHGSLTELR